MAVENKFSERFRNLIDSKKITQADVSLVYGFEKAQVSKWASGKIVSRRATIQKIADRFDCNIKWLADGVGQPFPKSKTETTDYSGEFERRKTDKAMVERLARMERAVFKTQCPGYFDRFFDFIADEYGATREGAEKFLEELCKDNKKYQSWDEKKKAEEESTVDTQKYA